MPACLVRPVALFVLSATLVSASAVADDVTATAAERASLLQFYGQQYPDQPAARTVFQSVPVVGGHLRELVGSVETAPYRGHGALCRTQRTKFVLQGRGKKYRWQQAGIEYYALLDGGIWRPDAEPVRLLQRVP